MFSRFKNPNFYVIFLSDLVLFCLAHFGACALRFEFQIAGEMNNIIAVLPYLLGLAVPSPYRVEVSFAICCFGFQAVTQFISSEMRAAGRFPRDALWQILGRTLSASGIVIGKFAGQPFR